VLPTVGLLHQDGLVILNLQVDVDQLLLAVLSPRLEMGDPDLHLLL
jgi:hypothetical protein